VPSLVKLIDQRLRAWAMIVNRFAQAVRYDKKVSIRFADPFGAHFLNGRHRGQSRPGPRVRLTCVEEHFARRLIRSSVRGDANWMQMSIGRERVRGWDRWSELRRALV
jgi:hypothetical protein